MQQSITAIVKPTHSCNFSCDYCYLEEEAEKGKMSSETLEKLIINLGEINQDRESEIIWHGGEPLIVGLDFYQQARYIQYWVSKEKKVRFRNSIQTNGSLVTQEVIDFCLRNNFSLGFSLDGPKEINDKTRKYKDGSGTFDDIIKGLNLAKQNHMTDGFIIVLTQRNIHSIDDIYAFLKENEFSAKFNPLIQAGNAKRHEDLSISPKEYSNAMIHLFDLYFNDSDFKKHIDPLDLFMGNIAFNKSYGCCSFSENCQNKFISVGPLGDVYPCGRFDGIADFKLGNLHENSLKDILNSPIRQQLLTRKSENIESCKACEYVPVCNSGCMDNGYMARGNIMDKDYYCSGYKQVFSHIKETIKIELEKVVLR